MLTITKNWRLVLSGLVLIGALGGPVTARAEEPEPPLASYDSNWTGGTAGLAIASAAVPTSYVEMADDVTLPAGDTYGLVTNVNVDGDFFAGTNLSSVTVRFYSNSSNLPGTVVYSQTANITSGGGTGDFQLALPSAAALRTSQTYWLSVQAQVSNVDGNWFWTTRTPQTGNPAAIRKSNDTNCQNVWVTRSACEPSGAFGPDLYFQLIYTPFTPTEFSYLPVIGR